MPDGTSLSRITPRVPRISRRIGSACAPAASTIPLPDGNGFWLKVNETLRGASAEALGAAFRGALA